MEILTTLPAGALRLGIAPPKVESENSSFETRGVKAGRPRMNASKHNMPGKKISNAYDKFHFCTKMEYLKQLTDEVSDAKRGDRVLVATMDFEPSEPPIAALMHELAAAARRGATVTYSFDAFVFIRLSKLRAGPLWYHAEFPRRLDRATALRLDAVKELRTAGVTVGITNQPHRARSQPFAGRSHIKAAIVNDKVYIGGCNLNEPEEIDLMVAWHDQSTADWLYGWLHQLAETEQTRITFKGNDQQHQVDDQSTLFIDAGVRKQSVILEQALALIDSAEEWLFITCQYFPHSVTAQHLAAAARRGVKVELAFNRASKHGLYAPAQQAVIWREHFHHLPKHFFAGRLPRGAAYIHAKLIACDQGALLGSHNYVTQGVSFGTAEIALLRRGPAFSTAAMQTVLDQITF